MNTINDTINKYVPTNTVPCDTSILYELRRYATLTAKIRAVELLTLTGQQTGLTFAAAKPSTVPLTRILYSMKHRKMVFLISNFRSRTAAKAGIRQ